MSSPVDLSDIRRDFERVSPDVVQKASRFAASILADVAGRRGTVDGRIRPLSTATRLCGPAFTIEIRPGDNLMIHAAMAMAKPGDILVVDGKADRNCALMGSIMLNACKKLGLGGVVLDAAHRLRLCGRTNFDQGSVRATHIGNGLPPGFQQGFF